MLEKRGLASIAITIMVSEEPQSQSLMWLWENDIRLGHLAH